jgi:RHS repeat-associated protein
VTFSSPSEVRATVPNGAVTGVIELTTAGGVAATSNNFIVDTRQDYQLTAAPSAATAVQGSTATYVIYLTSPQTTFTQLATLAVTDAPAGVMASFAPAQITAGARSTLSLSLAGTLSPGSYALTVRGSALADGRELIRTAAITLNVLATGQTTLAGRVLSSEDEPILGATVSLDGRTATTDAAGAFLLSGVTAGVNRPLMVDGRTASAPNRSYPVITEPATIVAGQANVVPYTFYLPPIDTQYEVTVVPNQDTAVSNPRVPGLQMTIPAGANLRNRDGSPVARVSITPLAVDRTPAPLPANVGTNLVYTSQPGGAIADIAMPVVYPNLAGADPGTQVELYAFNHDTVEWYIYGYGRVSDDGRVIAPEIDPATGRPYGLRDFSWHFMNAAPGGNPSDPAACPSSRGPNPVDYASGVKIEAATDIAFGGARGGLELTRIYTSDLAQTCDICPFGRGAKHNYDIRLTGSFAVGNAGRVVLPEQVEGRLFWYTRTEADGTLIFTTSATVGQLGDVVRRLTNGAFEYRTAAGTVRKFDTSRRLTAIVDRNGNTTTLSYTGANLTQITDPVGRAITLDYLGARITRATDPLGRVWQYAYDSDGNLTSVTDPLGQVTRYAHQPIRPLSPPVLFSITDGRGNLVKEITYNTTDGRVIAQRFADGGVESYSYTLSGRVVTGVTITDTLGRKMSKRFNASGYVIGEVDALGQSSQVERSIGTNLPLKTTGPCGCPEVTRQFDERGNVTASTDRLGQTMRTEYEPVFNNVTRVTDRLGRVTTFGYDARGNLISVTDALNQTMSLTYDQFGQLTSVTDQIGHTSRLEYDAQGNITASIDALGNRTTFEYDAIGRRTAIIDPLGRRGSVTYDNLDRVVTSTDSSNAVTRYNYDANGNLVSIISALARQWVATYDAKNRLISMIDPLGRAARLEYDLADELTRAISPSGRAVRYTYDARGQRAMMTDPLGGVIQFTYDNRGNLITLKDQRGNTTTFTYDELFRPTGVRDPLGRAITTEYNAVGDVTATVDRLGRRTSTAYDSLSRPAQVGYADAMVTYTYDAASRLTRLDDTQSGSIQWSYDEADRMVTETTPAGVVRYTYNAAGQRTSMTAADRAPVSYSYDAAGRLRTITQGSEAFTYDYDLLSRRMSLQRSNGMITSYSYDVVNRLSRLTHANSLGNLIEDFQYSYNLDDEIAAISSLAPATVLPSAKSAGAADAVNRIAQFGGAQLNFDTQGQITAKTDGQGTTSYQWDARGRLVQATLPTGQAVSYSYDALGRRVSRTANGTTTSFLYDGSDIVLDRVSGGGTIDYLNGPDVDDKLKQSSTATGDIYFLQDHLGSTIALANASGGIIEKLSYEAFGASTGSALTRYGFTGRELDPLTGLLHYRAREYDPYQGRFFTEDPIGFGGGMNFYAYLDDDPINGTDAFGLCRDDKECERILNRIIEKTNRINTTFKRMKDAGFVDRGGKRRAGGGITVPGGHYNKLADAQGGLMNDILEYIDKCIDPNDPPPAALKDAFDAAKLTPPNFAETLQKFRESRLKAADLQAQAAQDFADAEYYRRMANVWASGVAVGGLVIAFISARSGGGAAVGGGGAAGGSGSGGGQVIPIITQTVKDAVKTAFPWAARLPVRP